MLILWIILLLLWAGWLTQALLSALMQHKLERRLRRSTRDRYADHVPTTAVIVPFKGDEAGLSDHVDRLLAQTYEAAAYFFIVETEDDPARAILQAAQKQYPQRHIEILIAGEAPDDRGQKVHNQLCAMRHLLEGDYGEAVWVFADSDAAMDEGWLGEMVAPLRDQRTGCTTGYRWLIPTLESKSSASCFASVMNSSAIGFLVRREFGLAWGGSMAVRREVALELDYPNQVATTLSDDYMMSRLMLAAGLRIYFVPSCLVASPCDFDWKGLRDFAQRQYKITKVYMPSVYYRALMLPSLYLLGWATSFLMVVLDRGPLAIVAAALMLAVTVLDFIRSRRRAAVIRRAFGKATFEQMTATLRLDRYATPVWMAVHLGLMFSAFFGRTIDWRGKRYRMDGPQHIQRLHP